MRLFGYYAWHSFVNQLRKLFKTWVLIFLVVCMAIGALIGFGAAMLEDAAGGDEEIVESEVIEEEEPGLAEKLGIESKDLVELIVGGVILAVFAFQAISADKNGSRIFLPADDKKNQNPGFKQLAQLIHKGMPRVISKQPHRISLPGIQNPQYET